MATEARVRTEARVGTEARVKGAHVGAPLLVCLLLICFPAWADTAAQDTDVVATSGLDTAAADTDAGTVVAPEPAAAPAPLKDEISKNRMPEINVTVSPEKGAIGDLIEWTVEVRKKSAQDRVVLPSAMNFGKMEIQSRNLDDETSEKLMTQSLKVGLISFDTGEFEIPPQKLTVVDGKGNISEVMTPQFNVTIESLIANEPEPVLKKDEGEGEVVMVEDYTLLYILIALGAAVLIALITLLVHKLWSMRKPKQGPPPPPPRPAHEVAFEKLNALKASGYLDEHMHKTYHLKLSEAFREYLENRYGFFALEQSTREIAAELKKQALGVELHRQVVQLLEDTDLVKFAKYEPPKEESEKLLNEAIRMVGLTRSRNADLIRNESSDGGAK
ncbi:MAG: hypothetical protein JXX29_00795 [Deltaproteobacteria bacterium]|nr:hypothetical protein [Deltaproteobacteria bacterium]MBN2670175.1 hypothetical protein [Deltaproteobacteria bacterium]